MAVRYEARVRGRFIRVDEGVAKLLVRAGLRVDKVSSLTRSCGAVISFRRPLVKEGTHAH